MVQVHGNDDGMNLKFNPTSGQPTASGQTNHHKPSIFSLSKSIIETGELPQGYKLQVNDNTYEIVNKAGLIIERFDVEGNKVVRQSRYEYDAKNRETKHVFDKSGGGDDGHESDGVPDLIVKTEYNPDGTKKRQTFDRVGGGDDGKSPDGKPDSIHSYIKDSQGKVFEWFDSKADGTIDFIKPEEDL